MDTPQTMFQDVLEKMKVYAPGVSIRAADSSRLATCLAMMLDSWSNDRLACFANIEQSFVLTPNVNKYTIGNGGSVSSAITGSIAITSPGVTTLTVSAVASGSVQMGATVSGASAGTQVTSQLTGPPGGIGTYTVNNPQTLGSGALTLYPIRPLEILPGPGRAYLVDANNNRYPIAVVEQDAWNSIGLLTQTSQLPDTLFYDPQYPLGVINIFPMPLIAYSVFFDSRLPLSQLAQLNTPFSLPPGYMLAIKNNLLLEAWAYYKQGSPRQRLIDEAGDALGKIKRKNIKMSPSPYDSAIVSRAQSAYNIYSDSTNRGNG